MKKNRQRYIIFEILTKPTNKISKEKLLRVIWRNVMQIFGEQISFKVGLWIIAWDDTNKRGIIRVDHMVTDHIITALAFVKSINKDPVIFHSRKTTGTIKKAKKIWASIFNAPFLDNNKI